MYADSHTKPFPDCPVKMSIFMNKDVHHDVKVTPTMARENTLIIGDHYFYANFIRRRWFSLQVPVRHSNGFPILSVDTPNLRPHFVGCVAYDFGKLGKITSEQKWGKPKLFVRVDRIWFENEADAVHSKMIFNEFEPTITVGDNFFTKMDDTLSRYS